MAATILYIEDNALNMRLVKKLLNSLGHEMLEAMDATSGLHMVEQHQPDLILMDVNLPDVDGLSLTRQLKDDERYSHIPIVALTASAMYGDRERCLGAGCNGYIAKPVARKELRDVVNLFITDATV